MNPRLIVVTAIASLVLAGCVFHYRVKMALTMTAIETPTPEPTTLGNYNAWYGHYVD